jgi:hypothetical protein
MFLTLRGLRSILDSLLIGAPLRFDPGANQITQHAHVPALQVADTQYWERYLQRERYFKYLGNMLFE